MFLPGTAPRLLKRHARDRRYEQRRTGIKNVAVWIESEGITEGLHGDDGAGDGIIFRSP